MAEALDALAVAIADRYRIESTADGKPHLLGQGGMASVYLAHDLKHKRPVAIKVILPVLSEVLGPDRFLREIAIVARLNHPHILPLHDSGEAVGRLYYVSPVVSGGTLRDLLAREGTLKLPEAVRVTREVALALEHAHAQGVVHRDVKPSNILMSNGLALLADFGVARTTQTDGPDLSGTGVRFGTPRYMAPEQITTGYADERSDIYSLGCVLHEVLFGHTPSDGKGSATIQADASPGIAQVLRRALAIDPADRYQTARELANDLATGASPLLTPVSVTVPARSWRKPVTAGVVGIGLAAIAVVSSRLSSRNHLDPSLYVVVPFREDSSSASSKTLSGSISATLAYDALRRWRDLGRVDPFRVSDQVSRRGPPTTLDDALDLAETVGAGHVIWGEILPNAQPGWTRIRGVLFDVTRSRDPPREATILVPAAGDDSIVARFLSMVDTLVAAGQPRPSLGSPEPFAAVRAYGDGMEALLSWDLVGALTRFRRALQADPNYAIANLKAAQVASWLQQSGAEWRSNAVLAAADTHLAGGERLHAAALVALADRQFPQSCARYGELLAQDSLDFAAWIGLGECQFLDDQIIANNSSPTGWAFRSSWESASRAYIRAISLVPSAHQAFRELVVERLGRVLVTTPGQYRRGLVTGTLGEFAAFPVLQAETTAFLPLPRAQLVNEGSGPVTRFVPALERNRRMLDDLSRQWVRLFPSSMAAWESRAMVLEQAGVLTGGQQSAIASIMHARALTRDSLDILRLSLATIRVRVKSGDFVGARILSDSVLSVWRTPTPAVAMRLAPVAALIGKLNLFLQLLNVGAAADTFPGPGGEVFVPPLPVAEAALVLFGYSALGTSPDSLRALERLLESAWIASSLPVDSTPLRIALLAEPAIFGFHRFGRRSVHQLGGAGYLVELQAQLSRGDTAGVRAGLDQIDSLRKAAMIRPGQLAIDALFQEAWLRLRLKDTTTAARMLDAGLGTLPLQRHLLFQQIQGPPALANAMLLRSQLAINRGDRATATEWTRALEALWANADPQLRKEIGEMRIPLGRKNPK